MRAADYQTVVPAVPALMLPIQIQQTSSRIGALGTLAFVAPAGLALLAPFAMVAGSVVADPASRQLVVARPTSALLLALGLLVWCALLAPPLARAVSGLTRARAVTIANGRVSVEERGTTGRHSWNEPLSAYAGIMHVVRTTLSATRHEIILVHPDRARSVLVAAADQISDNEISGLASLLALPVMPASARYDRKTVVPTSWSAEAALPAVRAAA